MGQACPYLPSQARLLLPHPVWKELRKSEFLARISDEPSERLVKFWAMEQTRTKKTIQESFKHDPTTNRRCTAHTYMEKKNSTEYLVGLEKSFFEILYQHKQESLSLTCDSEASWDK